MCERCVLQLEGSLEACRMLAAVSSYWRAVCLLVVSLFVVDCRLSLDFRD